MVSELNSNANTTDASPAKPVPTTYSTIVSNVGEERSFGESQITHSRNGSFYPQLSLGSGKTIPVDSVNIIQRDTGAFAGKTIIQITGNSGTSLADIKKYIENAGGGKIIVGTSSTHAGLPTISLIVDGNLTDVQNNKILGEFLPKDASQPASSPKPALEAEKPAAIQPEKTIHTTIPPSENLPANTTPATVEPVVEKKPEIVRRTEAFESTLENTKLKRGDGKEVSSTVEIKETITQYNPDGSIRTKGEVRIEYGNIDKPQISGLNDTLNYSGLKDVTPITKNGQQVGFIIKDGDLDNPAVKKAMDSMLTKSAHAEVLAHTSPDLRNLPKQALKVSQGDGSNQRVVNTESLTAEQGAAIIKHARDSGLQVKSGQHYGDAIIISAPQRTQAQLDALSSLDADLKNPEARIARNAAIPETTTHPAPAPTTPAEPQRHSMPSTGSRPSMPGSRNLHRTQFNDMDGMPSFDYGVRPSTTSSAPRPTPATIEPIAAAESRFEVAMPKLSGPQAPSAVMSRFSNGLGHMGTALGAYGLYNQLTGEERAKDMEAGGNRASYANASLALNTTGMGAGLTSMALSSQMAQNTVRTMEAAGDVANAAKLASGLSKAAQIIGDGSMLITVAAGGFDYMSAREAGDGYRASRAFGGVSGAIAGGTIGTSVGIIGGAVFPPAEVVTVPAGGIIGGISGAVIGTHLGEKAFGEKLQAEFDEHVQEKINNVSMRVNTPENDKLQTERLETTNISTDYQTALDSYTKASSEFMAASTEDRTKLFVGLKAQRENLEKATESLSKLPDIEIDKIGTLYDQKHEIEDLYKREVTRIVPKEDTAAEARRQENIKTLGESYNKTQIILGIESANTSISLVAPSYLEHAKEMETNYKITTMMENAENNGYKLSKNDLRILEESNNKLNKIENQINELTGRPTGPVDYTIFAQPKNEMSDYLHRNDNPFSHADNKLAQPAIQFPIFPEPAQDKNVQQVQTPNQPVQDTQQAQTPSQPAQNNTQQSAIAQPANTVSNNETPKPQERELTPLEKAYQQAKNECATNGLPPVQESGRSTPDSSAEIARASQQQAQQTGRA